jgi:hypothetical protein
MTAPRYYSMRRLSPYQGTVQITELPDFRAVTSDGIAWRVQFLNQRSRVTGHAVWRADGGRQPDRNPIHQRPDPGFAESPAVSVSFRG